MKKIFLYTLIVLVSAVALAALFFTTRLGIASAQSGREWQTVPASVPVLETTSLLEIIPLYENDRVNESLDFGHGVSYLIRTDSTTIILDLGHNPDEVAKLIALSPHDSGPAVIEEFASAFPEAYQYIRVGEAIRFPKNK